MSELKDFFLGIVKQRPYVIFSVFSLLFIALMTFVEIKNGKFWTNDLYVYYGAVKDYFNGVSPYEHAYRLNSGLFKYPPPVLYLFTPLLGFPYFAAQLVHVVFSWLGLTISLIWFGDFLDYISIHRNGSLATMGCSGTSSWRLSGQP